MMRERKRKGALLVPGLFGLSLAVVLFSTGCPQPDGGDSFVAAADITLEKDTVAAGTPLVLSGTVTPGNATNRAIAWSVNSAGTTGATISGNTLNTTGAGILTVTAKITNGLAEGTPFTKDFAITVTDGTAGSPYSGFYNYPAGRVDVNNGRLTIQNTAASEVLLFAGTVDKDSYIGTVGSLGSVKVKLSEEKFYSIVAVEKSIYEERQAQAAQYNTLTYYSNTQGYTISVSPSNTYGGGNWVFNNNTTYWVEIKKIDLSMNYAVIAPGALRVTIPIGIGEIYDYSVHFRKEIKSAGKVVALVETSDPTQNNTVQVSFENPTFTTNINPVDVPANIKPAVMVKNEAAQTVRVYYSQTQKTNGAPGGDFVVVGGQRQLISGFEAGDDVKNINFGATAWFANKWVPASLSKSMTADKVYEITIPSSGNAADITVVEVNGSDYYN